MALNVIGIGRASAAAVTGVYVGPGAVSAHNNFATWLGSPVSYATDYVDYKNGWSTDFNPTWLIGPWSNWVNAAAGRRLVLGLPMLENSNVGQFTEGAAGAFDPYFQSLAQQMVSARLGNSIIRLGYEANCNTIGPWQATDNPSGYVAEFRHIVQVMRAVPGSSFAFDWTVCNGLQSGHVLDSFASFYPGDDVVDIIGMDQYDVKWGDATVTAQQRWDYNMNRVMGLLDHKNFAALHNKPVSYPEWGLYAAGDQFAGGGDDPYFIDQMASWISGNNTVYQSYFNLNWGGGVLSDFPNGQAEYKKLYGSTVTTPAPTPTPIAPTVTITSPANGATVSGKLTINSSVTNSQTATQMSLYINGTLKKTLSGTSTLSYGWAPKQAGTYTIIVKATNSSGSGQATSTVTYQ